MLLILNDDAKQTKTEENLRRVIDFDKVNLDELHEN